MKSDRTSNPDYFDRIKREAEAEAQRRAEHRRALWNRNISADTQIVAWIDILGFKNEMLRAKTDEQYQALYRKMLFVHDEFGHPHAADSPEERTTINANYGRTVIALSDGIVVAASAKAVAGQFMPPYEFFMEFIQDIQWAQANCALRGIFVRGGISIGPFYYKDDVLLSPALIRAYLLETERACYPAIIVPAEHMSALTRLPGRSNFAHPDEMVLRFKSPSQRSGERFYFIDYLIRGRNVCL